MYETYYALAERPFDLTANPRFLFLASGHREALSNLQYGVEANKGITLLLGEAGTGKTTLIRAALEQQRNTTSWSVYLSNPTLTRAEFYDHLAGGFGLSAEAVASKTVFLRELDSLLKARHAAGKLTALIVDEAQSMPHELLEEIRLLANLETSTSKLLAVVLTGQPELADRLNEPSLRQLKQRVALRCELPPFELRETAAYVAKRIRVAGGDSASVFTREAVEAIQRGSQGIARTISVICDNALINGFALQRRPVDADIVGDVCRDFDLLGKGNVAQRPGRLSHAGEVPAAPVPMPVARPEPMPARRDMPREAGPRVARSSAAANDTGLLRVSREWQGARSVEDAPLMSDEGETPTMGARKKRFLFF